ncbi:non-hydrolyzing UDP-N-acetylglucosamine 2-epimerase [Pedobacter rhodius]|uniref:UDP-N-acetylglucosamine 2-epimerase (non-hydrolyzing) n=1 Tax=Pedobacter rhodius TaxID=3004098 RepID=A0ABT4KSA5_9SPHI|nr:UDP-N-acetylglucosamine 2-epimerase (non-hydrolyzing) [Pedobacter sp. SJ11]MCZ4221808.1 UDP-N-acetylglucosamine 2-epimerase (non-hydrolyzing) [Pedobacter sp. SJ11]
MKISFIFGTRPEAIKMAPVIRQFVKNEYFSINICFTGQHQQMVIPIFDFFNIQIDANLYAMSPNQKLSNTVGKMFEKLGDYIEEIKPDLIFVQGDTTTAMVATTVAFYLKIKVAHIEAGLRTFDINSPFPEEFNRVLISRIADIHFAPTVMARQNLLNEGIKNDKIIITGNTSIDALFFTLKKLKQQPINSINLSYNKGKVILITCHRRENFGDRFDSICYAIKELAERYPEITYIFSVHLNPNVQEPVFRLLNDIKNVHLLAPLNYFDFVYLMECSYLILTDSGGIQEEAPSLGKPVLVLRDTTERQEAIENGTALLVGANKNKIIEATIELIENKVLYSKMVKMTNPFGDGTAAKKILHHFMAHQ